LPVSAVFFKRTVVFSLQYNYNHTSFFKDEEIK